MQNNHERFKQLLPHEGFTTLKPNDFKEMLKIIHNEQDKDLKHRYFTYILDKLFADKWGWYMRLAERLSKIPEYADEYAEQLPAKTQADSLEVLHMVRDMHIELKYRPSQMMLINSFIRNLRDPITKDTVKQAGTKLDRAKAYARLPQKLKQDAVKFNRARGTKKTGSELPQKSNMDDILKKYTPHSR